LLVKCWDQLLVRDALTARILKRRASARSNSALSSRRWITQGLLLPVRIIEIMERMRLPAFRSV
jgi:hypothetical protein